MTSTLSTDPHVVPTTRAASGPYLDLEPGLGAKLNTQPCIVRHHLTNHPLCQIDAMLELARRLPREKVCIYNGTAPIDTAPANLPGNGLSMEDSFHRIEETDTRIMLRNIELDPVYRELIHAWSAELEATGSPAMRGIWAREGFAFISAPHQVTPYHMDPEINFLFQVRGRKTFHILPPDRDILSDRDYEEFYTGKHESLPFRHEWKTRAVPFEMGPGEGVHVPVNHPHWVTTGGEISVSINVTVQTAATRRRGAIFACNHYLRRLGLQPKPFGHSAVRDSIKHQMFRVWCGLKSCLPRRDQDARY